MNFCHLQVQKALNHGKLKAAACFDVVDTMIENPLNKLSTMM